MISILLMSRAINLELRCLTLTMEYGCWVAVFGVAAKGRGRVCSAYSLEACRVRSLIYETFRTRFPIASQWVVLVQFCGVCLHLHPLHGFWRSRLRGYFRKGEWSLNGITAESVLPRRLAILGALCYGCWCCLYAVSCHRRSHSQDWIARAVDTNIFIFFLSWLQESLQIKCGAQILQLPFATFCNYNYFRLWQIAYVFFFLYCGLNELVLCLLILVFYSKIWWKSDLKHSLGFLE